LRQHRGEALGAQFHRWRRELRQGPGNAFPGNGKPRCPEGRIAELEHKIGQQALEIDFLKGCLQRIEEQRMRTLIKVARTVAPAEKELYPAWQGMQYTRNMFDGRAKLEPLDNDRYPSIRRTTARDVLLARQVT